METSNNNVFDTLYQIDFGNNVEEKMGLTYAPWALVWYHLKKNYPNAKVKIYENVEGLNYFADENSGYVKVSVTIEGEEIIEHLPIMDNRNKSIDMLNITSRDVTDTIQRCFVKACARHGLGLYIYLGLKSPEDDISAVKPKNKKKVTKKPDAKRTPDRPEIPVEQAAIAPRAPRRN